MDIRTRQLFGGRYQVRWLIGRGGLADVFRAHDPVTGRDVAVKAFRPGLDLRDAEQRRRREVDLVASLCHPGLVRVLDADVSDESERRGSPPFIVFELVEGPTLRRRIHDGPIDEVDVAALGARLAETLDHVHRHGVVHRDVKPANILMPAEPGGMQMAKLGDFGSALVVDSTRMTADGLTVGTANYLSPEQVTSSPVGPASDVYSLGLVLVEALTRTAAYGGPGLEAALARLARPPALPRDIEPSFAMILAAMTTRHPGTRITAREAARRLSDISEPSLANDIFALGTPCADRHRARHLSPARRPALPALLRRTREPRRALEPAPVTGVTY